MTSTAILITLLASQSSVCGNCQPDSCATPADGLRSRLERVVSDGKVIFGHHDDTAYGFDWQYEDGRSDTKETVGDYPGLINWDLGLIECDVPVQLDGVPFEFIAQEVRKQNARGGINSFSWHPRNPSTGGDSWDVTGTAMAEIASPGSALSDTIRSWSGKAARFIASLTDEQGRKIPVVFRPWHEHTGSWFWWGKDLSTPEQYKELWKITREEFDKAGADNVVWAYSPDRVASLEDYMERYPGDDYVDIFGVDIYHFGGEQGTPEYVETAKRILGYTTTLAKERGKLAAFTETGLEGITIADWYDSTLLPLCEEFPIAYVCVWRNAKHDVKPGHFYVPFKGHPAEKSFKKFHDSNRILFSKELSEIK